MVWSILRNLKNSLVSPTPRKRSNTVQQEESSSPRKRARTPNGMADHTPVNGERQATPQAGESSLIAGGEPVPQQQQHSTAQRQSYARARFADKGALKGPHTIVPSQARRQTAQQGYADVDAAALASTSENVGHRHAFGLMTRIAANEPIVSTAGGLGGPHWAASPGQGLQFTPYASPVCIGVERSILLLP